MRIIKGILRRVPDPRQAWKVKHPMVELLLLSIIAITAGANSSYEIETFGRNREKWLKRFMALKTGIPSRLTIERVLRLLNPKALQKAYVEIIMAIREDHPDTVISIDGKAYFRRHRERGIGDALYMVSAWGKAHGMSLGQVDVDGKSNEIKAIPELLDLLEVKGATVTIDAIGCQREIVKQIVTKKKADYLIALKANQQTLSQELRLYAEDSIGDPLCANLYTKKTTVEKGHGRIEKRVFYYFHDLSWFVDIDRWAGLLGLVMVRSTREVPDKAPTTETRFYITSLADPEIAFDTARSHWQVENNLHWSLDVVFREDHWKTKKASAAANLAVLRRLTAALLRQETSSKLSAPQKRFQCALDPRYISLVLRGK